MIKSTKFQDQNPGFLHPGLPTCPVPQSSTMTKAHSSAQRLLALDSVPVRQRFWRSDAWSTAGGHWVSCKLHFPHGGWTFCLSSDSHLTPLPLGGAWFQWVSFLCPPFLCPHAEGRSFFKNSLETDSRETLAKEASSNAEFCVVLIIVTRARE